MESKKRNAVRIMTAVIGVIIALSGLNHGIFEMLQGSTPTSGLIIQAIGPGQRLWKYGTEEAFSLVPDFLLTGIIASVLSILVAVWSIGFAHGKGGSLGLLSLCVLLFLFGGGIAQVLFFLPLFAYSTRIGKPLSWWRKVIPQKAQPAVASVWRASLPIFALCFLISLFIAVTGYVPGVANPDAVLGVCWGSLLVALILLNLSFISGFAEEILAAESMPRAGVAKGKRVKPLETAAREVT